MPDEPADSTFTVEDLPALFKEPTFLNASPDQRDQLLNTVISGAWQSLSSDPSFSQKDYQTFGKLAEAARAKNTVGYGERTMQGLQLAGGMLKGMATSAVTTGTAIMDAAAQGQSLETQGDLASVPKAEQAPGAGSSAERTGNIASTFTQGVATGAEKLIDQGRVFQSRLNSALGSGSRKEFDSKLDSFKSDLDKGSYPFNDAAKYGEWLKGKSDDLMGSQAKWALDFGLTNPANLADKDKLIQDSVQHAQGQSILGNKENAALVGNYIATRNPDVWKQLRSNLLKSPERVGIEQKEQGLLQTEGAKQFNQLFAGIPGFGDTPAHEIISASDPVTLASWALPMMRGAKVAAAASRAPTVLGRVGTAFKEAANLKHLGEMAVIGAESALAQNPNASLGDVSKEAAKMAAAGGIISLASGLAGAAIPNRETPPAGPGPEAPPSVEGWQVVPPAPAPVPGEASPTTPAAPDHAEEVFQDATGHSLSELGVKPATPAGPSPDEAFAPPRLVESPTAPAAEPVAPAVSAPAAPAPAQAATVTEPVPATPIEAAKTLASAIPDQGAISAVLDQAAQVAASIPQPVTPKVTAPAPRPPWIRKAAEVVKPSSKVGPPPAALPAPAPSPPMKVLTFDENGKLAKTVEMPREDAIRELGHRRKLFELLLDCLNGVRI